jgi:hypothetical protein
VGGAAKEIIVQTAVSRLRQIALDRSKSKKSKSWMSADGNNINSDEDAANLIGDEFLCGEKVDAAFAAIVGPT